MEPSTLSAAQRFTQTVSALPVLDRARRDELARNSEGRSPAELNQLVPEINAIELDNSLSQAAAGNPLRLVAWNLERGRSWRQAAQLLQTHPALKDADVLLLSEMDHGMARAHNEHTTRELAQVLGMNYAFGVEFLQLSRGTPQEQAAYAEDNAVGYHGNAILSRLPLQNLRLLRCPGIEKWYGSSEHRLGGRSAIVAEIQVGEQSVTLVSTHLESGPDDQPSRDREGQIILQEVAMAGDRPVVVGGDFNSVPSAPVIEQFRAAGFQVEAANDLSQSTFQECVDGQIRPGRNHIDYLLVRGLPVARSRFSPAVVMGAYPCEPTGHLISDHAAVVVEVTLQA